MPSTVLMLEMPQLVKQRVLFFWGLNSSGGSQWGGGDKAINMACKLHSMSKGNSCCEEQKHSTGRQGSGVNFRVCK